MSRKSKFSKPEPWKYMQKKNQKTSHENAIESYLVKLKELDDKLFSFWEDFWAFLSREREQRIDDIKDTLYRSRIENVEFKECSRIVSPTYSTHPLCTKGSVVCPGGRFNFGNISTSLESFHCLYIANDFQTAFAERYLMSKDETIGKGHLEPHDLVFQKPDSHIHCRVDVELESVLDISEDQSLEEFVKIISEITPSQELYSRAEKLNLGTLRTVKDVTELKRSIFEENFKQWGIWINQPSNSQWLGHYVRQAGINGIKYPSCKYREGFNIAIYPDTFGNTDSSVKLVDKFKHIDDSKTIINKNTFKFFQDDNENSIIH